MDELGLLLTNLGVFFLSETLSVLNTKKKQKHVGVLRADT